MQFHLGHPVLYNIIIDEFLLHQVHADLSEYNILWHDKECWYIDVSQAVEPNHPHGLEFLLRDCKNVSDFFSKKNVYNVKSAEELFTDITGLSLEKGSTETEVLSQVRTCHCNWILIKFGLVVKNFVLSGRSILIF